MTFSDAIFLGTLRVNNDSNVNLLHFNFIFPFNNFYFKLYMLSCFHSCLARSDFFHLLITFANRLDPDQDQFSVRPYLDPNCLTPWKCS